MAIRRKRPAGERGGPIGGVEAARTVKGVLRHMYAWAMNERSAGRSSNMLRETEFSCPLFCLPESDPRELLWRCV